MGAKFKIKGSSELPESYVKTSFDMGDDPVQALVYSNLAYDLVAAAIAKLGIEYSKWVLEEQTREQLEGKIADAISALSITS